MIFVQFKDDSEADVIAVLGGAQDPAVWPNQGQVEEDDPRVSEFYNPRPTLAEVIAAKTIMKDELLKDASVAMTPLFLALQLGDATDDERRQASEWRSYYLALQSVDVTDSAPQWPDRPPAA